MAGDCSISPDRMREPREKGIRPMTTQPCTPDAPPTARVYNSTIPMTEHEFTDWIGGENRGEWVDGEVVMMTPAGVEHNRLALWLASVLELYVRRHDLGVVLWDTLVHLPEQKRWRVPDLCFLAKGRAELLRETHLEGPPDLAVEIVSPESQARDWREKYLEYEAAGIQEYWVLDPMSRRAEFYAMIRSETERSPAVHPAKYRRLNEKDGAVASTVLPGFELRLSWLWDPRPDVLSVLEQLGVRSGDDS